MVAKTDMREAPEQFRAAIQYNRLLPITVSVPTTVWDRMVHVQRAYDILQSELLDALSIYTTNISVESLPKLIRHALAKAQRELY